MLKFNWKNIKKYTKHDMQKINDYFTNVYLIKDNAYVFIMDNEYASLIYHNGEERSSYMMNLEGFLRNRLRATKEELFVYLDLLSRRNSFTYYNTKGKVLHIPIWKACDTYDIDKLKANRLLKIDEHNIHFIYEEEITQ